MADVPLSPYTGSQTPTFSSEYPYASQQTWGTSQQPAGFYPPASAVLGQGQVGQQLPQPPRTEQLAVNEQYDGASAAQPGLTGAPVRRGLLSFFRRGNFNEGQGPGSHTAQQPQGPSSPDQNDLEAGPRVSPEQRPGQGSEAPLNPTGESEEAAEPPGRQSFGQAPYVGQTAPAQGGDALEVAMVSYEESYKIREELPAVAASVILQFDVGLGIGKPLPLPSRLLSEREGRFAREELGLYRERQCILSEHSLNKTEQRIVRAATLDRSLLQEMAGGNTAAAEQQGFAVMAQRQQRQQQQQQQEQLTVGELPTVTEEPEGAHMEVPERQGGVSPSGQPAPQAPALQQLSPQQLGSSSLMPNHQQPHQQHLGFQQTGPVSSPGRSIAASGPLPNPTIPIQDPLHAYQWLDENGLMVYVPNPLKLEHERPGRRYDQDKDMTRTYVRRPIVEAPAALRSGSRLYRLDIELGRLEFQLHPAMGQEDLLAARLLALFRDFKRRELVGLVTFYANRLAALEDTLLGAREKLFALQATEAALDDVLDAYAMLAKIEREVAEVRQLKEEEDALLTRTVHSMERLYGEIQAVRQQQGYALTNLELTVVAKPAHELAWRQGAMTRERLDVLLVAAELESVAGLPNFPEPLPVPELADLPLTEPNVQPGMGPGAGMGYPLAPGRAVPAQQQLPPFRLRRIETMCAAHSAILADVMSRLEAYKDRASTDPEDPVFKQLEEQAALVGRAPRRVAMTAEELMALQQRASDLVKAGQTCVNRLAQLVPVLKISAIGPGSLQPQLQPQPFQGQQPLMPGQQGQGMPSMPVPLTPPPPPRPIHKQGGKGRYYVKVFVNGHFVDYSDVSTLGDNFVADFRDVFSVQVSRFPESIEVQLFERNPLRDVYLSQVFIGIPGIAGTPHIDAQPKPYQFTALSPFRARLPGAGVGPMPLMPDSNSVQNYYTIFPAGTMYIRCGWVPERIGAGSRLADTVAPSATVTYENPLAERPDRPDIEAAKDVMPPMPSVPVDRMLRRAAERIGGKVNRAQIMRWLGENVIDPNDPRNAPLLELLKTHEANTGALGELFRLDIFPDVAMREDRMADKRMNLLARRWQAGIYRAPDKNVLKGVRSVPLRAPLSAEETAHLDNQYLDQLALLEEAQGGTQLAIARIMMARHEKAMQLQIGALLSNAIKEREERIRAFALRVRAAAARMAGGRTMTRHFRTEDVVNDAPLPQFKLELAALTQLLAPRRPLKRTKKLVKSLMTSVPQETQLMVTIQRAANLPARMVEGPSDAERNPRRGGRRGEALDGEGPSGAADRLAQQRNCFVEVRFRSITQRTVAVAGEFPMFNEQIDLDVFREDGGDRQPQSVEEGSGLEPSPSALQANNDLITLNVFDEIIREPSEQSSSRRRGDAVRDTVALPERERRFLGCVRVPLSSVYQLQVLEGTFKLEAPPVVLGYVQTSDRPATVSLYMTLRPRLAAPAGEVDERITSGEQEEVNRHAQKWLSSLLARPQCRSRVLKVMAVDADGAAVMACRYVAPASLPPALAQLAASSGTTISGAEMLMLKLLRFVSHLPYMEDTGLQKRRNDIWTSNAEFLHLTAGDFEEHAHLLAGYFLNLGMQCYIVMGTSTSGARSSLVLTTGQPLPNPNQPQQPGPPFDLNPQLLRLWNPVTGSVVSAQDPTGEMREVGQLYDGANIWANTQPTGRPWEMRWNLAALKDWQPFFGGILPPRELASVQASPVYEELDARFYEELEGRVEKRVEEALGSARATGALITRSDNKVARLLKAMLKEMPKASEAIAAASLAASAALAEVAGKGPTEAPAHLGERHKLIVGLQASHNERIRRESRAEAVHGHILALPFSDRYLEAVSDAVINTGIHRIGDERVKFSSAVYVEPLGASFVCCIWIYLAAVRG